MSGAWFNEYSNEDMIRAVADYAITLAGQQILSGLLCDDQKLTHEEMIEEVVKKFK